MALPRGARFRADDIWDAPEDGKRYEVIQGALYVSPPPTWAHQRGLSRLHILVGQHVYSLGLGEIVAAPVGVVLDDDNGLQPDLVFVSKARAAIITSRGVEGAPDLVVEMLSPSTRTRDLGLKMRRYAAAGVAHYWIGDPQARRLYAYVLTDVGYELAGDFGPGSVFCPELFPGLEIPIDSLWT